MNVRRMEYFEENFHNPLYMRDTARSTTAEHRTDSEPDMKAGPMGRLPAATHILYTEPGG